ncbi:hypothetical protein DSO57_1003316 [Entomophthora muscae]|uniref:Uncharacterized protein n=1 Tax=Entomophthora muscae TaxID=34485 RepID=A0ACC2T862_9FUNG|nr:hypothetical protein DSO57_1003316 [Entomophthora muscae]
MHPSFETGLENPTPTIDWQNSSPNNAHQKESLANGWFSSKLPLNGLGSSPEAISLANTGIKPGSSRFLLDHLNNVSILKSNLPLASCKINSCSQSDLTTDARFLYFAYTSKAGFVNQKRGSVVVLVNPNNGASPSGGLFNHQKVPKL